MPVKKAKKSKKITKGQTKASEHVSSLMELHKLQGVLLARLEKEVVLASWKYETADRKMPVSEVCRKWDIGSTYTYKLKDRAMALLRNRISKLVGRPSAVVERLRKKVADMEQLTDNLHSTLNYRTPNEVAAAYNTFATT